MVKNVGGGNKSKCQARKNTGSRSGDHRLRVAQSKDEIYAVATKMLGNCQFMAKCIDGAMRIGVIRGKFAKHAKDNSISVGTWVLLGARSWEAEDKKTLPKGDVLEVYSDFDKGRLSETVAGDWEELAVVSVAASSSSRAAAAPVRAVDDIFMSAQDEDMAKLIQSSAAAGGGKITLSINNDDEINVDDI